MARPRASRVAWQGRCPAWLRRGRGRQIAGARGPRRGLEARARTSTRGEDSGEVSRVEDSEQWREPRVMPNPTRQGKAKPQHVLVHHQHQSGNSTIAWKD
ncbi:hypothetical protein GOP47_0022563 [Adiantum capillus-veneris]|uniref:Uncharacterized protein n=1 Tax=Adiantum capillus-veneris TaxID=13818 RepID=A0A9D4U7L2_ADICA|nr:hypothetical protein GOP47_0022563 [Adiantum capillus-veneris]